MNNKRSYFFFIILSLIFTPINTSAQNAQNWISHISYTADIKTIVQNGDYIYALTDGKLFIYNQSDDSLDEFIKHEGGNSDITHIVYNTKHKCLLITRSDANMELLYTDKSYNNISDLKNYSSQNLDKTINHVFMTNDFAYISTNYGFSTINLEKKEIKESGIFNRKFYSICSSENRLYAATENGVYTVDLNTNIQDSVNWKIFAVSDYYTDTDYKFKDSDIRSISLFKDRLHFLFPDSAVYVMQATGVVKGILKGSKPRAMYTTNNDRLIILNRSDFWEYTDLSTQRRFPVNSLNYIIPNGNKQNEYWVASSGYNLSLAKIVDNDLAFTKQWIAPQGPVSNLPFSQTMGNNQLIVTGGGFYTDRYNNPASLSVYRNSKWSNIYPDRINEESGIMTGDFGYAISDPSNPDHIFAGSWGEGLYEFSNGYLLKVYDKTNSTIEEIAINDFRTTRIGGMAYDKSGNLWILNSMVKNIIKIYQKNGEWTQLYFRDIDGTIENTNAKNIFIDRYSNKWITSFRGDNFLFILNSQGTVSKSIHNGSFIDQNSKNLDIAEINDIAEDTNGSIWLATDIGPYWVSNSSNITSSASQIKLNKVRIDKGTGSNTVTGLLEDAAINAIKVDGANRKWIATQTSGVYLLSADNKEILEHFTLENSPLPSNNIISLSIDPKMGYVYFGSDRGLMAYNAKVTQGADDFSDVYVYPNPVRPDYSGIITISGLKSNTHVKITDVKGNLITEGESLGGQFVWDGLNSKGKRVDTGIYLVFGSSANGSEGMATKIMVVR